LDDLESVYKKLLKPKILSEKLIADKTNIALKAKIKEAFGVNLFVDSFFR
jgi:hypothetical protein